MGILAYITNKLSSVALVLFLSTATLAPAQSGNSARIPESVKAHHKTLFSTYTYRGKNLAEETRAGRDVDVTLRRFVDSVLDEDALKEFRKNPYPHLHLRGIACDADAVVVATPKISETNVTETGDSLFTDYRFEVELALKNPSKGHLDNTEIIVTRPGGETVMNGHSVRVHIADFPLFAIGQRYLLFLGHLPATDTFEAFGVGSFELTNGAVVPFDTSLFSSIPSVRSENAFLTEVRAAISAPCVHQTYPVLGKQPEGL
jgi:hypothetical protein